MRAKLSAHTFDIKLFSRHLTSGEARSGWLYSPVLQYNVEIILQLTHAEVCLVLISFIAFLSRES